LRFPAAAAAESRSSDALSTLPCRPQTPSLPETPPSREEPVGVYYTSTPAVDRALGRVRPAERKQFSLCAPKLKA